MSFTEQREEARKFAISNLPTLTGEVLYWRKNAKLAENALFHEFASKCAAYAGDDAYQEAERLTIFCSLELTAMG